jgi:hypothetical protein
MPDQPHSVEISVLCHGSGLHNRQSWYDRVRSTPAHSPRETLYNRLVNTDPHVPIWITLRAADYTSIEVSRLLGLPGHRSTCARQSMELENLELD